MLRHAVLGAGGVGGLLAAALARAGADVVLVLRPETLASHPVPPLVTYSWLPTTGWLSPSSRPQLSS